MNEVLPTTNTPQAAVTVANKWKNFLAGQQQQDQTQSGGFTVNLPTVEGYGGGQIQVGSGSTLGQLPVTQRQLGGITNGGLYGGGNTSINVLS